MNWFWKPNEYMRLPPGMRQDPSAINTPLPRDVGGMRLNPGQIDPYLYAGPQSYNLAILQDLWRTIFPRSTARLDRTWTVPPTQRPGSLN